MHRIVAFVISLILFSVSSVPSQCAETKPPFLIAFFLSGDDPTLPIYIYGQLRHVKYIPYMLSLGSIILLVSFVTISFAEWIRRRGMSSKKVYSLFE